MALDLTGDHTIVDGTETITHITSGGSSTSVTYALRQPLMIQDASGVWVTDHTKTIWHLWAATLTNDPAPGHELQQTSGVKWIVDAVTGRDQLTGKWELMCSRKQVSG